jgi:hypothetical protein
MHRQEFIDEDDGPGRFEKTLEMTAFIVLLLTIAAGVLMIVYANL